MQQLGYSLVDEQGNEVAFWGDEIGQCVGVPGIVRLPNGDEVHAAKNGDTLREVIRTMGTVTKFDAKGKPYEAVEPSYSPGKAYALVERWAQYGEADTIEFDGERVTKTMVVPPFKVTAERDRRAHALPFQGAAFRHDDAARADIAGAGASALAAVVSGAQAGDFRWDDPNADFEWIAADNSRIKMDAPTMVAFAKASQRWRTAHVQAARALKDSQPIPPDFAADHWWPAA